tara:strand:- start:2618 stop:2989 length:372 start_codon:yes stop_codon:yes gene_type:complete
MAILSVGLEKLSHFALAPTAERTADLDGTPVDLATYEGDVVVILDVEAGGTSTLDVKIQSSDTSGGTYEDLAGAAFTQVSATADKQVLVFAKSDAKQFIKAVSTTSTSTHTYSINAFGALKYG